MSKEKKIFEKFDKVRCISKGDVNHRKIGIVFHVDTRSPFPIYVIFKSLHPGKYDHAQDEGIYRSCDLEFI